jgi:quercetin dioxygenase-like cupin family protein
MIVSSIEGKPMHGQLLLKPLMRGDQMTMLELHFEPGAKAPLHIHTHESLIYVVSGQVKTWIGDDVYILGPGDVARHPVGVLHTVEALVASTILEVKSPAPDITRFIGTSEQP